VVYAHIFEEVESGRPLDPERAKALKASTDALLQEVTQVRGSLEKQATRREPSSSLLSLGSLARSAKLGSSARAPWQGTLRRLIKTARGRRH
jgi:hypothetical protein